MKRRTVCTLPLLALCVYALPSKSQANSYTIKVLTSGLDKPTGLSLHDGALYFTEVPTPGVSGAAGGLNSVKKLDLEGGYITVIHGGDPQPVNITVGRDDSIYWTCLSAGVILKQDKYGVTSLFLTGLSKPSGIVSDHRCTLYFTEVPQPGVANGKNGVFATNGETIETLHMGEPEPVEITVAPNGDLYWTCHSAGVILTRSASDGTVSELLTGLKEPTGITIDHRGRHLYFTEVPTPGVSGANGGANKVSKYNLRTGKISVVHAGDPQPNAVAVSHDGKVYWTCTSAGVILEARPEDWDDEWEI